MTISALSTLQSGYVRYINCIIIIIIKQKVSEGLLALTKALTTYIATHARPQKASKRVCFLPFDVADVFLKKKGVGVSASGAVFDV